MQYDRIYVINLTTISILEYANRHTQKSQEENKREEEIKIYDNQMYWSLTYIKYW